MSAGIRDKSYGMEVIVCVHHTNTEDINSYGTTSTNGIAAGGQHYNVCPAPARAALYS